MIWDNMDTDTQTDTKCEISCRIFFSYLSQNSVC